MSAKVADVLVFRQGHVPDDIILFGAGVHCMSFVLREVNEINAILFAVEYSLLGALLAVVDYYLVVGARGDDALPIIAVVNISYLLGVVLVELRHPHTADDVVHKLHVAFQVSSLAALTASP